MRPRRAIGVSVVLSLARVAEKEGEAVRGHVSVHLQVGGAFADRAAFRDRVGLPRMARVPVGWQLHDIDTTNIVYW